MRTNLILSKEEIQKSLIDKNRIELQGALILIDDGIFKVNSSLGDDLYSALPYGDTAECIET